jgi:hypothetical protein
MRIRTEVERGEGKEGRGGARKGEEGQGRKRGECMEKVLTHREAICICPCGGASRLVVGFGLLRSTFALALGFSLLSLSLHHLESESEGTEKERAPVSV